jgi:threonine aldolase
VGILAAAGLYALEHNVRRLAEDHANARLLAEGLRAIGPFRTNEPQTNIVMVDLDEGTSDRWAPALADAGVLATVMSRTRLRMVTNLGVDEAGIKDALSRIEAVCERPRN